MSFLVTRAPAILFTGKSLKHGGLQHGMIEAPEPPHHHHHKTGIPWFDLVMPLAVLAISLASLLTSLQSERSMHALVEQNRRLVSAQSTPLLMTDTGNWNSGQPILTFTVSNVGTGPARIAWFRLSDPQGVDYSGGALTDRVDKLSQKPSQEVSSQPIAGTLMRSGDQRTVWSWPRPIGTPAALAEWEKLNHDRAYLRARACYCSIFDECRITEFGESRPKPVSSCTQADDKS